MNAHIYFFLVLLVSHVRFFQPGLHPPEHPPVLSHVLGSTQLPTLHFISQLCPYHPVGHVSQRPVSLSHDFGFPQLGEHFFEQ